MSSEPTIECLNCGKYNFHWDANCMYCGIGLSRPDEDLISGIFQIFPDEENYLFTYDDEDDD